MELTSHVLEDKAMMVHHEDISDKVGVQAQIKNLSPLAI